MNDDELRRAYAAYRTSAARETQDGSDRPSLEDMQQLLDGTLPYEQREPLLNRVLSHAESTRELAMLSAVSQASAPQRSWKPAHWWTMAAAAVIIVIVGPVLWRSGEAGRDQVYRATTPEHADLVINTPLVIIAPRQGVPLTPGLRVTWSSLADADRYIVELVSDRGDAVASIASPDTSLLLPDSISLARLRSVSGFMVVARLRDGGQRQSLLRLTAKRAP